MPGTRRSVWQRRIGERSLQNGEAVVDQPEVVPVNPTVSVHLPKTEMA